MKLLTKKLIARFQKVGQQDLAKNPIVICKFFSPAGAAWYATEYDPKRKLFFGYVAIPIQGDFQNYWESFSIADLERYGANRDLNFKEKRFLEIEL